jgi:predicted dinucleotide-utilizing enzyme
LSFDPNRDDKFDALIVETARNYKRNHNKKSLKEAMSDVLETIDIFQCTPRGAVKIHTDAYLKQLSASDSGLRLRRVIGKTADLTQLTDEEIHALASGDIGCFDVLKVAKTDKGKTRLKSTKKNFGTERDHSLDDIRKAREVIIAIADKLDIIILGTNNISLEDALNTIRGDKSWQQVIEEEFAVPFALVDNLLTRNVINRDLVELLFDR